MLPLGSQYTDVFQNSYQVLCTLDLYIGDTLLTQDVPITQGTVTASRAQQARRSLSCEIPIEPWRDVPLDVYSSRVQVWMGFAVYSSFVRVPLGVFRVDSLSRTDYGVLSVTGSSLEAYVIEHRFEAPRTPTKGISTVTAISTLIHESLPEVDVTVDDDVVDRAVSASAPWERERWDAIDALADSIDASVYCDPSGVFVIRKRPSLTGTQAVWKVREGEGGVLVSASVSNSREKVYNAVVAMGQSSDADVPPVYAVAYDLNPESATYWGGPFGKKPKFYSSQLLVTKAQCLATATSMLVDATAHDRTIDFSAVPNPTIEPDDIVQVSTLDGMTENHLITELTMPLGGGLWAAKTLSTKADTESPEA